MIDRGQSPDPNSGYEGVPSAVCSSFEALRSSVFILALEPIESLLAFSLSFNAHRMYAHEVVS